MAVYITEFGTLPGGEKVDLLTLSGEHGMSAGLLTYGAALQSLVFAGKDVVLGFDRPEDYAAANGSYQGATVGRYANRIAGGRFALGGRVCRLACNENGKGHLHGGNMGFDRKIWDAEVMDDGNTPCVRFSYVSEDGEEGYPGRLSVSVDFMLTQENSLYLQYTASTDADTVLNLTNHAYFNLNGWEGGNILDTELTLFADGITPIDDRLIPTGAILPVEGTPFDFRKPKPIGFEIDADHEQLKKGCGYDHNYVLGLTCERRLAVRAVSPRSGICLECFTDQPGVQLYTANYLNEKTGKGGLPLYKRQGFCLETQHFPDSPNHPQFPTTLLRAGETFRSVTEYRFSVVSK